MQSIEGCGIGIAKFGDSGFGKRVLGRHIVGGHGQGVVTYLRGIKLKIYEKSVIQLKGKTVASKKSVRSKGVAIGIYMN